MLRRAARVPKSGCWVAQPAAVSIQGEVGVPMGEVEICEYVDLVDWTMT